MATQSIKNILGLGLAITMLGCQSKSPQVSFAWKPMQFAHNFSLSEYSPGIQLLQIPTGMDTLRYALVQSGAQIPDELSTLQQIQVPIRRAVVMAAPTWGHLLRMGASDVVVGLTLRSHVVNPQLRQKVEKGEIAELGQGLVDVNFEQLLRQKPEVLLASTGQDAAAFASKLEKVRIPILQVGDYLESHPLGRAEWSKLTGALVGKTAWVDSEFNSIVHNYQQLKQLGTKTTHGPSILWGSTYMGSWYIAGGQSYQAQMMRDAGGRYIFDDDSHASSVPMTTEQVLKKGADAELWLNPDWSSRSQALSEDSRYSLFKAIKGPIWKYDLARNKEGLYGIFEEGAGRPDLQLQDLLQIFHPELGLNRPMNFYRLLP